MVFVNLSSNLSSLPVFNYVPNNIAPPLSYGQFFQGTVHTVKGANIKLENLESMHINRDKPTRIPILY